jgi:hypothetical protein
MIRPGKADQKATRVARLRTALRENLKRRKEQARGRAEDRQPGGDAPADAAKIETKTQNFGRNRETE